MRPYSYCKRRNENVFVLVCVFSFYLGQRGYVIVGVGLFVCVFLCEQLRVKLY